MYINSGYHNHSLIDFKDKSRPLIGWKAVKDFYKLKKEL